MRGWPALVALAACAAPPVETPPIDPSLELAHLQLAPAHFLVGRAEAGGGIPPTQAFTPTTTCDEPLESALLPAYTSNNAAYAARIVPGDLLCIGASHPAYPGRVVLQWKAADRPAILCDGVCPDPVRGDAAAFPMTFQLLALDDDGDIAATSQLVTVTGIAPTLDCNDDPFEPNDTANAAIETAIGNGATVVTYSGLAICPHGDIDIFRVKVPPDGGHTLRVTTTSPGGGGPSIAFRNAGGTSGLSQGAGNGSPACGSKQCAPSEPAPPNTAEFSEISSGEWSIRVSGRHGDEFTDVSNYNLRIELLPWP